MGITDLIPGFSLLRMGIAAAALVAVVGAVQWYHHDGVVEGRAEVQTAWNADKFEKSKAALVLVENRDRAQADLQAKADKQRSASNAQIRDLDTRLAAAVGELRNRPERPASGVGVPEPASAGGGGCTADKLYREDASAALRIAADADRIAIALQSCQAAYRAGRQALTP